VRWLTAKGDAYRDEHGRAMRMIGVIQDITERRRAADEIAALLDRESQARRDAESANRAKDEFLATLSHELRTPLNVILGWAEVLSTEALDDPARTRALHTIERNARRQARLIEDLLDISRIVAGKLELRLSPTDLRPAVGEAVEGLRSAAEAKGLRLVADLRPTGSAYADPVRLQQIVSNLIGNAIKFTPPGGRIDVALMPEAGRGRIVVSDTGEGISRTLLPHVFDRFRQADATAKRSHGGLGLGLAIVRELVQMHGGTVEGASEGEGCGARFTVDLPLMTEAAVSAVSAAGTRSAAIPERQALLLHVAERS
jgi:signal transduction histidine kinase